MTLVIMTLLAQRLCARVRLTVPNDSAVYGQHSQLVIIFVTLPRSDTTPNLTLSLQQ